MACTCSSPFSGIELSQQCTISVSLTGTIEVALTPIGFDVYCGLYSIGNQTLFASTKIDCSNCLGCSDPNISGDCCNTCHKPKVYINGQVSPVSVCDGDLLSMYLVCEGGSGYSIGARSVVFGTADANNPNIAQCCVNTQSMSLIATMSNNVIKLDRSKIFNLLSRGTRNVSRI